MKWADHRMKWTKFLRKAGIFAIHKRGQKTLEEFLTKKSKEREVNGRRKDN